MTCRSKVLFPFVLLYLWSPLCALGWEDQKPLQLNVKESVEVATESAAVMVGPFECDSDEDVFLMPPAGKGLPNTVLKISADGRKTTRFSLASIPDFEKSDILAYSVGLDDHVYILTTKGGREPYVVTFDNAGKLSSVTKLDVGKGTVLRRIATTDGANYFIGGTRTGGERLIDKQLDGIFDARGEMIAPVTLTKRLGADESQARINLSIVRAGEDGNFYFARLDPQYPVLMVSPQGQIIKEIRLFPPKEAGFELLDIKISRGRLAVAYQGEPPPGGTAPVRIYVYDIQGGQEIAEYFHENWQIGVALACYSHDHFTFIAADENGKMHLVTASAR